MMMFDSETFIRLVEEYPVLYDNTPAATAAAAATSDDGQPVRQHGLYQLRTSTWREVGARLYQDWDLLDEEEQFEKAKEMRRKWKQIRDSFVKDLRRKELEKAGMIAGGSRDYCYKDILQFMLPIVGRAEMMEASLPVGRRDVAVVRGKRGRPRRAKLEAEVKIEAEEEVDVEGEPSATSPRTRQYTRRRGGAIGSPGAKRGRRGKAGRVPPLGVAAQQITFQAAPGGDRVLASRAAAPEQPVVRLPLPSPRPGHDDTPPEDPYGNRAFLQSFAPYMDGLPADLCIKARMKIAGVFASIAPSACAECGYVETPSLPEGVGAANNIGPDC